MLAVYISYYINATISLLTVCLLAGNGLKVMSLEFNRFIPRIPQCVIDKHSNLFVSNRNESFSPFF